MPYWREHSSIACPQCQGGERPMAPRSVSEQTDAIMRHLASSPSDLAVGGALRSGTMAGPTWPEPLLDPGEGALDWRSPTPEVEPQSYQRIASPAAFLQLGARGLEALRKLGPAAAAALAAIIKSYQDQLGRPPSPEELDRALSEQAGPRPPDTDGTTLPSLPLPGSASEYLEPHAIGKHRASKFDEECERLLEIDKATCNGISRRRGKQAAARCWKTAMDRNAECLRYGYPPRTPLDSYNN